jgi:peroxiredoxin
MTDPTDVRNPEHLPARLPVPVDDGACAHLVGLPVPDIELPGTAGTPRNLRAESMRRWVVVYAYPRTGRPGEEALGGQAAWDATPGARGCTPQSLGYRAAADPLAALGAVAFGLSTQTTPYQREAVERLGLPHELLSDHELRLTRALRLPTFSVAGHVLLRRHTLFLSGGVVRRVRYPVFPPDSDADEALEWLRRHGEPPART